MGSVLKNKKSGKEVEVLEEKEILFLRGGKGGYGNSHFKGPKNRRPKQFTEGKEGEGGEFFIELKLVVDLGLVGFPNAGKSSLLNALTAAKAKVGSYKFTTLTPNLGDLYGFILADIPGLIEGASKGKGLGYKFLRHISRTKMLLHCISCENDDPVNSYKIIREELGEFDKALLKKPEIIVLTKTDLRSNLEVRTYINSLNKIGPQVYSVSIIDDDLLKKFRDNLVKSLKNI